VFLTGLFLRNTVPSHTVDLPNLYKKSIVFFRSLQSLVSLLPAFQLRDRLIGSDSGMTLGYRLRKNHVQRFDEIPYGKLNHELTKCDERTV
jgi:hypothetical protein